MYGNGDTITVQFDAPTNAVAANDAAALDSLFTFSQSLGSAYSGVWTNNNQTLVITIDTAASDPGIGA